MASSRHSDAAADHDKIVEDLKKYCGMDSYAMTVVFKWLQKIDQENINVKSSNIILMILNDLNYSILHCIWISQKVQYPFVT